jgi:hypothetical protein
MHRKRKESAMKKTLIVLAVLIVLAAALYLLTRDLDLVALMKSLHGG